jgi:hypothetical protein
MKVTWLVSCFGFGLGLFLLGYAFSSANSIPTPATSTPQSLMVQVSPSSSPAAPTGQQLPITAEAEMGGQMIQLEVARTPEQQAMGLMHRPELPDNRGMLFPFDPPRPSRFWMKNTPEPLDMVFLLNGEIQAIVVNAPPCTADPCPTYGTNFLTPVNQVIELRAGRAEELGLKVGDQITIRFLE